MNEQRNNKQKFITNKMVSDLDTLWDGLNGRLNMLTERARSIHNAQAMTLIANTQTVIKRNKPNKKMYRTILRRVQELEELVTKMELLYNKQNTR